MIIVNVNHHWPSVLAGKKTPAQVTLYAWHGISDKSLEEYADVVLGIYKNTVVSAFDITGWNRISSGDQEGKIEFFGEESNKWRYLVGQTNPGEPWVQGAARPVKYLPTDQLTKNTCQIKETNGTKRAEIDGFVLSVSKDGVASVEVPHGKKITFLSVN